MDFSIELYPGTDPISIAPYRMAPVELKELNIQLKELQSKGLIGLVTHLGELQYFFVKKKDGSLRLCVDYRKLNRVTVKKNIHYLELMTYLTSYVGLAIFQR